MNACLPRSRLNLRAALAELKVETRPEWQPGFGGKGWTHCNQAAEAACRALEVPMPPGLLANQQADYLTGAVLHNGTMRCGADDGWLPVKAEQVTSFVNLGFPVLGVLKAPTHGHIVVGSPAEDLAEDAIHVWQAGRQNFECKPVTHSWTRADCAKVAWFVHN